MSITKKQTALSFNWKCLETYINPSDGLKKRIQQIILDSARHFYPDACIIGNGSPAGQREAREIEIFFFKGPINGMHLVFPDSREMIWLNYLLVDSEGILAGRASHEFSHSFDYLNGLLPAYCEKGSLAYLKTQIRATRIELEYMEKLPVSMRSSTDEKARIEEELRQSIERQRDMLYSMRTSASAPSIDSFL